MKNPIQKVVFAAIAIVLMAGLVAMNVPQQQKAKAWPVPAEFKNMKNPVKATDESVQMGAMLYKKYCASCHGKVGLGDGVKARSLETFPGDFSDASYQGQTDGEHFYKTKTGRDEMPAYDKKVSDEDMWNMVNYMRTFKK